LSTSVSTQDFYPKLSHLFFLNQTVVGTDPGLESVRSGAVSAFIAEAPTLRYYAGKQPCDVAVVGKSFGPSVYVLGLQVGYRCQDSLFCQREMTAVDEKIETGYSESILPPIALSSFK
jgi:hypothetical protein